MLRILLLSVLLITIANAKPYKTDYDYSTMDFEVKQHSLAIIRGSFSNFVYRVDIDDEGKLNSISGAIRTNSLDTKNKKRDGELVASKDFFNYEKFLRIYFKSTSIEKSEIHGEITIKGITKPIKLKYSMRKSKRKDGKTMYLIKLQGALNRKDFKIGQKIDNSMLSDQVNIEGTIGVYDDSQKIQQTPKVEQAQKTQAHKPANKSDDLVQLAPANLKPINPKPLTKISKETPPILRPSGAKSIEFTPNIIYEFYLDNTERTMPYANTRTLFSQSISPRLDFKISENKGLQVGFVTFFDMGAKLNDARTIPLINYNFNSVENGNGFYGSFGIFDRSASPLAPITSKLLFRDDYVFYRPLINGVRIGGVYKNTNIGLIFDWYGTNVQKRVDKFYVMPYVRRLFKNHISIGTNVIYDHFKDREYLSSITPDTGILDRLYYEFYAHADLKSMLNLSLDNFEIKLASVNLNERKRTSSNSLQEPVYENGGEVFADIAYAGFGFSNKFYAGDSMMTLFKKDADKMNKVNPYRKLIDDNIYATEALYQSPIYNKSTIYYQYKDGALSARFGFSLNVTQKLLSNSQLFTIKYSFR